MDQYQFSNQTNHENEEYIRLRNQNQEVQEVKKKLNLVYIYNKKILPKKLLEEVFWLKASASSADIEAQYNSTREIERLKALLSFKVVQFEIIKNLYLELIF